MVAADEGIAGEAAREKRENQLQRSATVPGRWKAALVVWRARFPIDSLITQRL
jgi:hypothetical protein